MEPCAPGRLSPTFSSSPKLKLLGILSTSGPDGWKMCLLFHLGFQFPIIQCIVFSVHQQTHCTLAVSVREPAANLEPEGAASGHL